MTGDSLTTSNTKALGGHAGFMFMQGTSTSSITIQTSTLTNSVAAN